MPRRPPRSTLFPYTTLFRSSRGSIPSASTAERWSVSGTVTFSSTLSAPLIRASNCCNCSSDSRGRVAPGAAVSLDRKSTRLNSSHVAISYAVFCLKKKTEGQFTTFAYVHARWLPRARRFRERLEHNFVEVKTHRLVWSKIQPAYVTVCRRAHAELK